MRPRMIRVVVQNLAQNAVRYAGPGSTLRLTAENAEGGVELVAGDDGVGVAEDDLPRLFERFYRDRRRAGLARNGAGPRDREARRHLGGWNGGGVRRTGARAHDPLPLPERRPRVEAGAGQEDDAPTGARSGRRRVGHGGGGPDPGAAPSRTGESHAGHHDTGRPSRGEPASVHPLRHGRGRRRHGDSGARLRASCSRRRREQLDSAGRGLRPPRPVPRDDRRLPRRRRRQLGRHHGREPRRHDPEGRERRSHPVRARQRQTGRRFPAEPVPGTPGAFTIAGLSLPTAGEWSFTVVIHSPDAEPETGTTKIAIEASAGAG